MDDEGAAGAEDDPDAAETRRDTFACWEAEEAWPPDVVALFHRKLETDDVGVQRCRDLPCTAFQLLQKFNDQINSKRISFKSIIFSFRNSSVFELCTYPSEPELLLLDVVDKVAVEVACL